MSDIPPCLSCGTCCFSTLSDYVRVDGDDYSSLGDDAAALTQFSGNKAYMRMVDGHCASLQEGGVAHEFFCSVYVDRPKICRELARGSPQCLGERDAKSARPQAWVTLRRPLRKAIAGGVVIPD